MTAIGVGIDVTPEVLQQLQVQFGAPVQRGQRLRYAAQHKSPRSQPLVSP